MAYSAFIDSESIIDPLTSSLSLFLHPMSFAPCAPRRCRTETVWYSSCTVGCSVSFLKEWSGRGLEPLTGRFQIGSLGHFQRAEPLLSS